MNESFLVGVSNVPLLFSFLVFSQRFMSWPVKSLQFFRKSGETESADSEEPVKGHGSEDIEDNVSPKYTEVSPYLAVVDVRTREELICLAQCTICAVASGSRVLKSSGCGLEVSSQVLPASLACRWLEDTEFGLTTHDFFAVKLSSDDTADPVGEGRYAVHEDPEPGKCIRRLHDTVEDQGHGEQKGYDRGG